MSRRVRPYLFYSTTSALCPSCLLTVEAKILLAEDKVILEKWCRQHGTSRVIISDDVEYYRKCREVFVKAPELPEKFSTKMEYGCPYDCGLCPDHMQHSCLTVIDITERCNLSCPVCYADSSPDVNLKHRSLDEVKAMLDATVKNEGHPDVVQLSGGEPTLHPDFFEILTEAKKRPIRHLMVNTNGIKLATEPDFVKRLSEHKKGLEMYLQFDSLKDDAVKVLRGANLSHIRHKALEQLEAFGISTTLVVTLKKGLNDSEIGEIIAFALKYRCIRGVTLQPIQDAGRNDNYELREHRLLLSEVRRKIVEQSNLFSFDDVMPVPCNPDNLAMAYAMKIDGVAHPLTRYVEPQVLIDNAPNTISFEVSLKEKLFSLLSTGEAPTGQAARLQDLLCCFPDMALPPQLTYENVFRVLIVQFMDQHSMDIRALKKSCVHFAQPDGQMIPFESYNVFYRSPAQRQKLELIRKSLSVRSA